LFVFLPEAYGRRVIQLRNIDKCYCTCAAAFDGIRSRQDENATPPQAENTARESTFTHIEPKLHGSSFRVASS